MMPKRGSLSTYSEAVLRNLKRCEQRLDREREKLDQMIGALNGVPIAEDKAILKQSRKVDRLVARVQKMRERKKKIDNSIFMISGGGNRWM
jgi:hypothetical protein